MDTSIISGVAALVGAGIGGLTTWFASWTAQRAQARAHWVVQDVARRQDLYKEFIEDASKCYVHALQNEEADIPALVGLYAKLGRMRVLSSPEVLETAERIERKIVDTYLAPSKTFLELREMINSDSVNCSATSVLPAAKSLKRFSLANSGTQAGVLPSPRPIRPGSGMATRGIAGVLFAPSRSWPAHIVELGPIGIEQGSHQPPAAPLSRHECRGRRMVREQAGANRIKMPDELRHDVLPLENTLRPR